MSRGMAIALVGVTWLLPLTSDADAVTAVGSADGASVVIEPAGADGATLVWILGETAGG